MKMKKIFILGGLLLSGALVSGCSDFLEVKKYGASTVWETQGDIDKAIAALYSFTTNDSEGVTGRGIMWFECCSDNLTVGCPQSEAEDIRNFRMAPSNGRDVKNNWKIMYEVNAKANNIIKMVPTMNLDEAYKRKATGIAYFFRGFAMLWIAPYYGDNGPNGGIPIILDTTEPADMDIPRPASVLQNYDQIIRDLREAGERLPYFSELAPEEYGLPHKAAAWAFAARAALYAAQFDAKYYDTVIEMCDKVMALSGADKRDLFDDGTDNTFANLWRKEQNFGCEYIFSLLGNASDGPKFHGMSFQNGGWGLYNHWGYFQPTLSLWEAFEEGDIRRDATILYPGQTIKFMGREILFGSSTYGISSDTGMTFRKFLSPWEEADCVGKDVNPNGDNASNTLGMCLMRYADVLLMKAEALIWTKGEGDAEAKQLLNRIRKRARLEENSTATKAELKNQRRCELAFEFMPSRHLDMVRWGDAKEAYAEPTRRVNSHWDSETQTVVIDEPSDYDQGRTFDPVINQVFPIPVTAFNGTVNLKQNIGY